MFDHCKYRAKKKGLPFDLAAQDIYEMVHATKAICPVLGIPLIPHTRGGNRPSLDRHKPERGYTKSNVSVISQLANQIKNNGTAEQIQKVADYAKRIEAINEHHNSHN